MKDDDDWGGGGTKPAVEVVEGDSDFVVVATDTQRKGAERTNVCEERDKHKSGYIVRIGI